MVSDGVGEIFGSSSVFRSPVPLGHPVCVLLQDMSIWSSGAPSLPSGWLLSRPASYPVLWPLPFPEPSKG